MDYIDHSKKSTIIHMDIESQRRQEMATLYNSLRSLLPFDYLKGRRSLADYIHEAVNYIKHLEEKIQELNGKRDKLRKLPNSSSANDHESLESSDQSDGVIVKRSLVGVEVVIDTSLRKNHLDLPLSGVIEVLTEEGLSIVSCCSAKVEERMLHSIKSEVRDEKCIDVSALKQKLTNSIGRLVH